MSILQKFVLGWLWLALAAAASARECFVYFGTFTNESSRGIYVSRMDLDTGEISAPELAAEAASPNYLAVSPDGKHLYAAVRVEEWDGEKGGAVSAYQIDTNTGKLKLLNTKSSGGAGPCHVSVDKAGRCLFVANYAGGSVKSFRLNADGSIGGPSSFIQLRGSGPNPIRQAAAHAHWVGSDPAGKFVLTCDLGTDKVLVCKFDTASAALMLREPTFAEVPAGAGPRHLTFSPDGRFAYVVNEMGCSVTRFSWNPRRGRLSRLETVSLLPDGVTNSSEFTAAEIEASPDGRFVFATVRGHDSLAVLQVDPQVGKIELAHSFGCGGKVPRGLALDPSGRWLLVANQKTDAVTLHEVDVSTGKLKLMQRQLRVGGAVDVKFANIP